jgi:hypothetical protein
METPRLVRRGPVAENAAPLAAVPQDPDVMNYVLDGNPAAGINGASGPSGPAPGR